MKTICKTIPIDIPIYGEEDAITVNSVLSLSTNGGMSLTIPPAVMNLGKLELLGYLQTVILPEVLGMIEEFRKI